MRMFAFMKIKMKTLLLPLVCLALNGCVVRAAVDLAATTVMTAGKVVVKGTGAVIDAAIPDRDKKKDREKDKGKKRRPVSDDGLYPGFLFACIGRGRLLCSARFEI